jgi:glucose/mannose-6-phosphate isomerase
MTGTGVLDDPEAIARLDTADMLERIASLPGQLGDAWRLTRNLQLPEAYRAASAVLVLGMGGSAIGADLVRGIFDTRLRLPLLTVRGYDCPAFAGPSTLVVAASFSGGTEETLGALEQALRRGCPAAAITTGGPLLAAAARASLPFLRFPGGGQPRAAVGWGTLLLAGLLERAGVLDLDGTEVASGAAAAEAVHGSCGPDVPTDANPAKQLAWSLLDRLPVVEAGGWLAPVARRWKTQLNENAKTSASWEELPEATHNAVVGYAQPESLHERMFVVFLSSPDEHPGVALRARLSGELLDAHGIPHQHVRSSGSGPLAQAFSSIMFGDLVSAYLAILYGVDPTPVEVIGRLKTRLAEAAAARAD